MKKCKHCQQPMTPKKNDWGKAWEKRKFCSKACQYAARKTKKTERVVKPCENCGKEIVKKRWESKTRFAKKRFCSTECAYEKLKEEKKGYWRNRNI